MHQIFLSYSHDDADVAKDIGSVLSKLGIAYFQDVKNIEWGSRIEQEVTAALEGSKAVLVIVSPASIKSAWVPFEIGYFTALKRRVLPYLVHPSTDLPGYLSSLKHIATMEELSAYFSRVKNDWDSMQNNHLPSLPNVIVRYSPGLTQSHLGNFITLVTFFVENHDTQKVFMSSVSLLLDDGRRMQITNDGLTGAAIPRQVLEPGQRMDVTITRKDLDANSIRPENVVGVVAVDDIGRRFHGDPSHLQACLAELVSRA